MPNERNRDDDKKQSSPGERHERQKPDDPEIAAADANEEYEPNDLGEAERVFEETNGGHRPREV